MTRKLGNCQPLDLHSLVKAFPFYSLDSTYKMKKLFIGNDCPWSLQSTCGASILCVTIEITCVLVPQDHNQIVQSLLNRCTRTVWTDTIIYILYFCTLMMCFCSVIRLYCTLGNINRGHICSSYISLFFSNKKKKKKIRDETIFMK